MAKRKKKDIYFIFMNDSEKITVTEDVYYGFKAPHWKEKKRSKRRVEKEYSYEVIKQKGLESNSDTLHSLSVEKIENEKMINLLYDAINQLKSTEQKLIDAIYFNGATEAEFATEMGISQQAISKQKKKVLNDLKNKLKNI